MDNLSKYIDHTILKPEARKEDIKRICEEAKEYNFKAVCINPIYVKYASEILKNTEVLVENDIESVVKASKEKVVKVIIETCLLTKEEIVKASEIILEAGADFVKTSTGFSTGGAEVEDVELIKSVVKNKAKIKASGGIRNKEKALKMIEAGADRIGASSSINIVK